MPWTRSRARAAARPVGAVWPVTPVISALGAIVGAQAIGAAVGPLAAARRTRARRRERSAGCSAGSVATAAAARAPGGTPIRGRGGRARAEPAPRVRHGSERGADADQHRRWSRADPLHPELLPRLAGADQTISAPEPSISSTVLRSSSGVGARNRRRRARADVRWRVSADDLETREARLSASVRATSAASLRPP